LLFMCAGVHTSHAVAETGCGPSLLYAPAQHLWGLPPAGQGT
jgi:hypothetical protein